MIKILNKLLFFFLLVIYLAFLFFYFFKYKKILKKNRKFLLKFEKKKLLISLILEFLYLTSIFLIGLSFVGIYLPLGIKKDKVYLFLIDTSGSMQANDFKPSRLEVAKKITKEFIEKNNGYFGIIAFSDYPLLVQYPTNNKKEVIEKLKTLQAQGGTDLGDALKTAYSILDNFIGYDRYIILLSDGKPTQGEDPLKVVRKDIPIFTVAIGSENKIIGYDPFGRPLIAEIDKELLRKLAKISNGMFFEATQTEELIKAYKEISDISNQKELDDISSYLIKTSFILLILILLAKIYLTLFNLF